MTDAERALIEQLLRLLSRCAGVTGIEATDVEDLIAAGEYGVALETLAAAAAEDGAAEPQAFDALAGLLAPHLGLREPPFADRLRARSGLAAA